MSKETIKRWNKIAHDKLVGRKIVKVHYMGDEDMKEFDWFSRPLLIHLDDGNIIFPSMDDEGNDGGALFCNDEDEPILPTLG